MQQQTIQALQLSHQQTILAMQASMDAANQRMEQRMEQRLGELFAFFKQLVAPAQPAWQPTALSALQTAAPSFNAPTIPVFMQGVTHTPQTSSSSHSPPTTQAARDLSSPPLVSQGGNSVGANVAMNTGGDVHFGSSPTPQSSHPPSYSATSATASSRPSHQ